MNYCRFRNEFIKRMANAGGGLLPVGFTQLEYIESTGTQYLNIGAIRNHRYFDVDFMQTNTVYSGVAAQWNANALLGASNVSSTSQIVLRYKTPFDIRCSFNSTVIGSASIELNTRYRVYATPTGATLNGADITTRSASMSTSGYNCLVFCDNTSGNNPQYFSAVRLYHLQTSSIDLYPCIRNSDNKPGMYDIVTNTFFTNAGTGEFTVGNPV